jgi:NSS family neurotransmitter:Na+ symporter
METVKKDQFSSRWAFLIAALGMAIGAGNIWRFPRLAGQYGGSFLIPWMVFLFLWSIPLIVVEFSIGKKIRMGVIGSFNKILGEKLNWMGFFIAFCTIGIMFYYTVVCGWSLKYLIMSLTNTLFEINQERFWDYYTSGNWEPFLYCIITVILASFTIYAGIANGIEKVTKILIPMLFILLIIASIKALTLPNASKGLKYFFHIRMEDLTSYKVWLESLTQSAWSTGAGWGLVLTYATYVNRNESIFTNSILTGLGNNLASLIAGLAVIPTVFALSATIESAHQALDSGNQGLTFIFIPRLFNRMVAGKFFSFLFFLTLFIAAISSLIAMMELAVRILMDLGMKRKKTVAIVGVFAIIFSFPSAISLKFFNNQDWVWSIGLLLSGFFFVVFVLRSGVIKFREIFLEYKGNNFFLKEDRLKYICSILIVEFVFVLSWWFSQSVKWTGQNWWHPFSQSSIGTCLFQWSFVLFIGWLVHKKIGEKLAK